jgi:hypothetical protein
MTSHVPVEKREGEELPVPTEWRRTISQIVDLLQQGRYEISRIPGAMPLSEQSIQFIRRIIEEYGASLCALPEETWHSSLYQWMGSYWYVIVDLYTREEGRSDLAMFLKVYRDGGRYRFDVESVHVP